MLDVAAPVTAETPSPGSDERAIDLVHLSRMTLGDRSLEREVLQLFDRQSTMLIERMEASTPAVTAAIAHTLKGSARGVGATRVASAADAVELACAAPGAAAIAAAIRQLAAAAAEARTVIAELLRAS